MIDAKMFSILEETRIYKKNGKYELTAYLEKEKNRVAMEGSEAMLDVLKNKEKKKGNEEEFYYTFASRNAKQKQQPWIVIKSLPLKRYVIKEGDMLRIGKQKVRVK